MSAIRILLIGPDPGPAAGLCAALRNQLYDVDTAANGLAGKELLTRRRYDLIVLARDLPDIDGCKLCANIRGDDRYTPVMIVASGDKDVLFEGFAAGADDYIRLPVDNRVFLARIRALIRRTVSAEPVCNRLKTGDIVLDLDSKLVRKGGKEVVLTVSEFLLLEYLMRNKNRIIPREELLSGVWGEEIPFKQRKVPTHFNNLRQKLKEGSGIRCLYTVTGKGYILVEK